MGDHHPITVQPAEENVKGAIFWLVYDGRIDEDVR
jgi:hypothetical protein